MANWTSFTPSGTPTFFVPANSRVGDEVSGTAGGVTVGVAIVDGSESNGLSVSFGAVSSSKRPRKEVGRRVGAGRIVGAMEGVSMELGRSR